MGKTSINLTEMFAIERFKNSYPNIEIKSIELIETDLYIKYKIESTIHPVEIIRYKQKRTIFDILNDLDALKTTN